MPSYTRRTTDFRYINPARARPTQYEEVTSYVQWSTKNSAVLGWFNKSSYDGRPIWSEASRLRAGDWWGYRSPSQLWNRTYVDAQATQERSIEGAIEGAKREGRLADMMPRWRDEIIAKYYAAYRYLEYGYFLAFCYAQREAPCDLIASTFIFQGMDKDRHAQAIALYGMDLEEALPGFSDGAAHETWMNDPVYQASREYVERLLACRDWGEITIATNLLWEPLGATLFTRELLSRGALVHSDPVTWVLLETVAVDRKRQLEDAFELVRFVIREDPQNREVIQEWLVKWAPLAVRAAKSFAPLFGKPELTPTTFEAAWQRVTRDWKAALEGLTLSVPTEGVEI